jgi:hypothetical protein
MSLCNENNQINKYHVKQIQENVPESFQYTTNQGGTLD